MKHCKANLKYLTTDFRRDIYQAIRLDGMGWKEYQETRGVTKYSVANGLNQCYLQIEEEVGQPLDGRDGTREIRRLTGCTPLALNRLPFS